jgi:hypothetical protein
VRWCQRRIGGRKIVFHLVKSSHRKLEGCDGIYHPDEGAVYLDRNLEPSRLRATFVHEICHVIDDISGASNALSTAVADEKVREDLEEQQTRSRTMLWQQLLEDHGFTFPKVPE